MFYGLWLLVMMAGALLPTLLAEWSDRRQEFWTGMMIPAICFVYVAIRAVGRANPAFWRWVKFSKVGMLSTGFVGAVLASSIATAVVALPLPFWAIGVIGGTLALVAVMLVMADKPVG